MDEDLTQQLIDQLKALTIVIEKLPDNMADALEEMLKDLKQEIDDELSSDY